MRYDHYDVFTPDQTQLAYTFPSGVAIPAADSFAETHYVKWNSFVPRLGMTYDLMGTGKTVLKVELRPVPLQPGRRRRGEREPEPGDQEHHLAWTDTKVCATCIPGDQHLPAGRGGQP